LKVSGPPLLEAVDVAVRRDSKVLLERVSLEVAAGTVHLLVGPNGAGKSTLFSALLGMTEFSGTIRFNFRGNGRIGYVPQRFAVDRTLPLTVAEFLALPRRRWPVCLGLSRAARRQAEALLATVGLAGYSERQLGALSGGELQRVLLANAMEPVPELLLLDEPATGLDETAVKSFEAMLLEARRASGATVLMVSHDLAQARRIADRVTILNRTVLRSGPPEAVLSADLAGALLGIAP
jgi:zinc transport system ATP-binding protein